MKHLFLVLAGCLIFGTAHTAMAAATAATAAAVKEANDEDKAESDAAQAEENAAKADAAAKTAADEAARAEAASREAKAKVAEAKAKVLQVKEKAKAALLDATRDGTYSCADWADERSRKDHKGPAAAWLNGYLSGIQVAKNRDFLSGTKREKLYLWVDEYCSTHQLEFISDAGIQLYAELSRNKGVPK